LWEVIARSACDKQSFGPIARLPGNLLQAVARDEYFEPFVAVSGFAVPARQILPPMHVATEEKRTLKKSSPLRSTMAQNSQSPDFGIAQQHNIHAPLMKAPRLEDYPRTSRAQVF